MTQKYIVCPDCQGRGGEDPCCKPLSEKSRNCACGGLKEICERCGDSGIIDPDVDNELRIHHEEVEICSYCEQQFLLEDLNFIQNYYICDACFGVRIGGSFE